MGKEHTTFVLQYAPTKMMPLSPILTPTVKIRCDTVSLVETLMAVGASVPTSPYTAAKGNSVSVQWQGTGEEVHTPEGRSVASGHGCPTSNPGAWHRGNGGRSTIPVPTGVHGNCLAGDIRCWGIHKQGPAWASGIVFKQQLVFITHHTTAPMRAKQPCRGYFFALAHLQPPPEFLHELLLQTETQEFTSHGTHTFLMSFSVWEESQSKMQREMRALETSEQLFTWAKWRGREKLRICCKEMSMDTKSSTGSEGANGSKILKT